ncbi:unnamed protein product [Bursaphelenchus okinawaensis]|uniref:Uncharacterized protein n=1 Tax=Bursaphelenchus okinawaensis TaxID=465554 RepID=A0A811LTA2_9BILA|nr:unnamed protein product [Bursaphelenchus okinawaensis]CAG9128716.1 unnamed protein product [Bursaphelenchus okinawaensis]
MLLAGKVALVTGASRGIGKGVAIELGKAGATVYVTGRSSNKRDNTTNQTRLEEVANTIKSAGGNGICAYVDHSDSNEVKRLFERISEENHGQLDILVNNSYAAANFILSNSQKKFWEYDVNPEDAYDIVNNVGLRNHYICTVHAARLMVKQKKGLIVNIGSLGGINYFLNVAYGIGKSALDRLTSDSATELAGTGNIYKYFNKGETSYYPGKCILKLFTLENLHNHTGDIITTTNVAKKFNILDTDGRLPEDPHVVRYSEYITQMNMVHTSEIKSVLKLK